MITNLSGGCDVVDVDVDVIVDVNVYVNVYDYGNDLNLDVDEGSDRPAHRR